MWTQLWVINMNKKKIVYDVLINIISSSIPIVLLQMLVLPYIARFMPGSKYGLVITVISVLNVVPSTIGNTLNNIRLIYNTEYEEEGYSGDFGFLLLQGSILNIIVMIIAIFFYGHNFNSIDIFSTILASSILLLNSYYIVAFRIKLNFWSILINNVVLSIGYIVGTILFKVTNLWQLIYLTGYIFNFVFLLSTTDIWKEKTNKTPLFKITHRETLQLLIANILKRLMNYADKLVIYPLMGGTAVAIYYAATILSKVISLIITPINGVAISYLSKLKNKPINLFRYTLIGGSMISIVGYIFIIFISRPMLSIMYPQYMNEAMRYIYVTSAATVLMVLNSMILPFVMKFCKMKWQIVINGITLGAYFILSLILFQYFGLMGFCVSLLISRLVNFMIMIIIYLFFSKRGAIKNSLII